MSREERQLDLINDILSLAGEVQLWLRGGWAVDFCVGNISRPHEDIDWFMWADDANAFTRCLTDRRYEQIHGSPPNQQRDFRKDGLELSFALLARNDHGEVAVAGGPWAGQAWPDGMLDAAPGELRGIRAPIISPQAQIEIKTLMPVWIPGRPRRHKDALDIAVIRAAGF